MGKDSSPSILRQLIGGTKLPEPRVSETAQSPTPAAVPSATQVEANPTTATTGARLGSQETVSRSAPVAAEYLGILTENAPVAMAIFDAEMRYLHANPRWLDVFQLDPASIIGRPQYEVFPSLHPGWRHVYERALTGQVVRSDRDTVNQSGQPVLYRWEVRPWRRADGGVGGVMITCLCIAGMRSRDATEAASGTAPAPAPAADGGLWTLPLPVVVLDPTGRVCRAGAVAGGMFLSSGLRLGQTFFWQLFAGRAAENEVCRLLTEALREVISGARPSVFLKLPLMSSGEPGMAPAGWHLTRVSAGISGVEGDSVLAIGMEIPAGGEAVARAQAPAEETAALVAEIARLEAAVKEAGETAGISRNRELRLRSVLESVPCGLILLDERGRPVYYNERVALLLGPPTAEGQPVDEWLGRNCRDEQHRGEVMRLWRESVWRKQLTRIVSLGAGDGLVRDLELRPSSLPSGGVLVMVHDVTDERRSEELLRATEAKFRTLVHENPLPIVLTDRSGSVFEVNAAAEALLGCTRAELRRMALNEWFAADGLAERARVLREMMQRGDLFANVPVEVLNRDGQAVSTNMRIALVPDSQGQPAAAVHFFRPVEKPQAADPSTTIFTALDDSPKAPQPIPAVSPGRVLLSTDAHGRVAQWNDAAEECFGVGREEAVGRGLHTFFRPSDATGFYAELSSKTESGGSTRVEWNFFHPKHGRMTARFVLVPQEPGSLSLALTSDGSDESSGPVSSAESATPAVSANVVARASAPAPAPKCAPVSLDRERMLLGEAHHRVKNHLQIITSMLNLQLSTMQQEDAKDALRSSQNRVRSIAELHQHLYALAMGEAGSFADFGSGLIAHLRECYGVGEDRVKVELSMAPEPVLEEWLMPLALSLNEMVSNSFKHAYPCGWGGNMKITLSFGDDAGELVVQDDGAGLPAEFDDHKCSGLGLKIMRVFAGQLGGEVRVSSEPGQGARFCLRFPLVAEEG